jgi:hypothetical protein
LGHEASRADGGLGIGRCPASAKHRRQLVRCPPSARVRAQRRRHRGARRSAARHRGAGRGVFGPVCLRDGGQYREAGARRITGRFYRAVTHRTSSSCCPADHENTSASSVSNRSSPPDKATPATGLPRRRLPPHLLAKVGDLVKKAGDLVKARDSQGCRGCSGAWQGRLQRTSVVRQHRP